MKALIISVGLLVVPLFVNAQIITKTLEGNNVKAKIANNGVFFNNNSDFLAGYEMPKGDGNHLIYANAFWFGAIDSVGGLKMCANMWESQTDLFPGALSDDGTATAPDEPYADEIYLVSKSEIEYHVSNFFTPGYVIPHGILNWPAHGDVALDMAYSLAPFADLNGNETYEPELGEYPEIRGDHAAYLIMNDRAGVHESSGGDPLGIEVHFMFYQYETEDEINNTTFINVRIINRTSETYPEFIVGNFMDLDIGDPTDDYIGCNVVNNVMFGYNGDLYDDGTGDQPGYEDTPPAIGVVSLNNAMHVCGYFNNDASPYGDPSSPEDYWNYLNARWKNGAYFQLGGNGNTTGSGVETNHIYLGETIILGEDYNWTEVTEANPPGDRRMFMASESVVFGAGEVLCYDYAVITKQLDTPYESANAMAEAAAETRTFYYGQPNTYCDFTLGLEDPITDVENIVVYPNPSTGNFTIDMLGDYDVNLFAMDGRLVYNLENASGTSFINQNLSAGTYLLVVTQNELKYQSKIIVRQ